MAFISTASKLKLTWYLYCPNVRVRCTNALCLDQSTMCERLHRLSIHDQKRRVLRLFGPCSDRPAAAPEDLSSNLIVQLGVATEELNRSWYESNTGQAITNVQRRVIHPVIKWMAATLDGTVDATGAVFEAKFMLPWSFSEEAAAEKY